MQVEAAEIAARASGYEDAEPQQILRCVIDRFAPRRARTIAFGTVLRATQAQIDGARAQRERRRELRLSRRDADRAGSGTQKVEPGTPLSSRPSRKDG